MGWYYTLGATRKDIIKEIIEAHERPHNEGYFKTIRHCCSGNVLWTVHESKARNETGDEISAEGLYRADLLAELEVGPVVTVLPRSLGDWRSLYTPAGRRVIRCPHEYQGVQCIGCGGTRGPLCSWPERDFIIGLTAHGRVRKVEAIVARMEANKGQISSTPLR